MRPYCIYVGEYWKVTTTTGFVYCVYCNDALTRYREVIDAEDWDEGYMPMTASIEERETQSAVRANGVLGWYEGPDYNAPECWPIEFPSIEAAIQSLSGGKP